MTRAKSLTLLAFFLITCPAVPAHATKYAGEFLKIPVGARAIGMGGAFVAVTDDATAPYWNPAGGVYLPYRFKAGRPFHAGLPWQAMDAGLKGMSTLLARR